MPQSTLTLVILIAYQACLLGIGFWARRRSQSEVDFFLAGRTLGPFVAALSYSASSSSAWVLLGFTGLAYTIGLGALWVSLGSVLGMLVAWYWIAPRMRTYSRRHELLTLTGLVAQGTRGYWRLAIVWVASLIVLFSFVFYIAAQFQGVGNTFTTAFSLSWTQSILLGGAIVMIYTLLGGFWAVSVTDTIQGMLMMTVALILPIAAWRALGGWEGLTAALIASGNSLQLSWTAGNAGLLSLGFILGGLAISLGAFGQPHLMVRFMALRDDSALRWARLIATVWFLIVFSGMFFVGLAGRVLFPSIDNSETIFFLVAEHLLPATLGAVVLAAVLSAIMSTADSQLLVGGATVTEDLGLGQKRPHRILLISRLVIALLTVLAVLLSLYIPATIFSRVLFAWAALGAAFGPLVFCRLAGREIPPGLALSAILVGFLSSVLLYLLPNTIGDVAERLLPFVLGATILLLGSKPRAAAQPKSSA